MMRSDSVEWEMSQKHHHTNTNPNNQSSSMVLSFSSHHSRDVDIHNDNNDALQQQQQEEILSMALQVMGSLIEQAQGALQDLSETNTEVLGKAIVRKCQECADALDQVAQELEQELNDNHTNNTLRIDTRRQSDMATLLMPPTTSSFSPTKASGIYTVVNSPTNEDDNNHTPNDDDNNMMDPFEASTIMLSEIQVEDVLLASLTIIKDAASSLRDIQQQDASEIAEVTLTLAEMLLLSLNQVHATLVQQVQESNGVNESTTTTRNIIPPSTVTIEELDNDGEDDDDKPKSTTIPRQLSSSPSSLLARRQRLLWPPLKPILLDGCTWGWQQCQNQPVIAAGVAMMTWPLAIPTAIMGGSIMVVDDGLQHFYNHMLQPKIPMLEEGAAQVVQSTKLGFLISKLAVKQAAKVVERQVERQGGIEKLGETVVSAAMDRITHPVETIGMTWNGLCWSLDRVVETCSNMWQDHQDKAVAEQLLQ